MIETDHHIEAPSETTKEDFFDQDFSSNIQAVSSESSMSSASLAKSEVNLQNPETKPVVKKPIKKITVSVSFCLAHIVYY